MLLVGGAHDSGAVCPPWSCGWSSARWGGMSAWPRTVRRWRVCRVKTLLGSGQADGGGVSGRRLLPEGFVVVSSILCVALGENLGPLDQATAALWCRSLFEGAAVESIFGRARLHPLAWGVIVVVLHLCILPWVCVVVPSCMMALFGRCFIYKAGRKSISWIVTVLMAMQRSLTTSCLV